MTLRWLLFVCLFLPVSLAAEAGASLGISGEYRCGPGDRLSVQVFEVEELSGPVAVDAGGAVRLPLIGAVEVAGLTTAEVEARVAERYSAEYLQDPQITVLVEDFGSQPVSVLGAVETPGVYQLQGARRLTDVLALAGGLNEQAGDRIVIRRGGTGSSEDAVEIAVPVRQMLESGIESEYNPVILPHDTVQAEAAGVVYVMGSVNRPGGFPIKDQEQITVLQAVSLAEGSKPTASLERGRIIRTQGAANVEIPISVKEIIRGHSPDSVLEPNDVLYIPDSRAKSAMSRGAEAVVQMAVGLVIWRR